MKSNFPKLFLISCLALPFANAQDSSSVYELSPYSVKSYWHEESGTYRDVPNPSLYHTRELANVMKQSQPDVGIIRKAGTSNDIIIRGLSQDNLNITIDETKVFCACSNRMDPPISQVTAASLESIELTQGAFDLSKSGSLGGSVKITTRQPSEVESGLAEIQVGSYNQLNASLLATGGSDQFQTIVSFEWAQQDPYEDGSGNRITDMPDTSAWPIDDYLESARDDRAFRAIHGDFKIRYLLEDGARLQLEARYREDDSVLYPGLRMDADYTQNQHISLEYASANDGKSPTFQIKMYANQTDHDMSDRRRLSSQLNPMLRPRPQYVLDRGFFMETLAEASVAGIHAELQWSLDSLDWEAGFELTQRDWEIANRLGGGMPNAGPGAEIFNAMIPDSKSRTYGTYAQASYTISDTQQLDFGLRLDAFQTEVNGDIAFLSSQVGSFDDRTEWKPSAKLVYRQRLNENLIWHAGVGSTARIANAQERYIQLRRPGTMPNWLGNPDLDSPTNTELTTGISWVSERISFNAKVFYSVLSNYIYLARLNPSDSNTLAKPTQSYANIDANLWGASSSVQLRLSEQWSVISGLSWQRGRKDSELAGNDSENLAEIPALKGMTSVIYTQNRLQVSLDAIYADSQDNIDPNVGEIVLDSYLVFNLRGNYELSEHFTVSLGIENLADQTYASHNAFVRNPFSTFSVVNEPGRTYFVSLNTSW